MAGSTGGQSIQSPGGLATEFFKEQLGPELLAVQAPPQGAWWDWQQVSGLSIPDEFPTSLIQPTSDGLQPTRRSRDGVFSGELAGTINLPPFLPVRAVNLGASESSLR